jgi:hypothetical protein
MTLRPFGLDKSQSRSSLSPHHRQLGLTLGGQVAASRSSDRTRHTSPVLLQPPSFRCRGTGRRSGRSRGPSRDRTLGRALPVSSRPARDRGAVRDHWLCRPLPLTKSCVPSPRLVVFTVKDGLEVVPPRPNRHRGDLGGVGERCQGDLFVLFSGWLIHTSSGDTRRIAPVREAGACGLPSEIRYSLAGRRRELECRGDSLDVLGPAPDESPPPLDVLSPVFELIGAHFSEPSITTGTGQLTYSDASNRGVGTDHSRRDPSVTAG